MKYTEWVEKVLASIQESYKAGGEAAQTSGLPGPSVYTPFGYNVNLLAPEVKAAFGDAVADLRAIGCLHPRSTMLTTIRLEPKWSELALPAALPPVVLTEEEKSYVKLLTERTESDTEKYSLLHQAHGSVDEDAQTLGFMINGAPHGDQCLAIARSLTNSGAILGWRPGPKNTYYGVRPTYLGLISAR